MDSKNTKVEVHATELQAFSPTDHAESAQRMGLTSTAANQFDSKVWDQAKPMVAPMVWAWYDAHKDQKITTVFGFITVTVSSFGIAEMVLTAIFGARS
jgi:hypothetical protein